MVSKRPRLGDKNHLESLHQCCPIPAFLWRQLHATAQKTTKQKSDHQHPKKETTSA